MGELPSDIADIDENRIDKVMDLDSEKVFGLCGLVAVLSDSVYRFDENTRLEVDNPVPVRDDNDTVVGFCTVYAVGERIWANVHLNYSSPERLSVQVGAMPYYLQAVGEMHLNVGPDPDYRGGRLDFHGEKTLVRRIYITSITITSEKPADPRITVVESI